MTLVVDKVFTISPPPLVFPSISLPRHKMAACITPLAVQNLSLEHGDDQEGPIRLIIQVPLLVWTDWVNWGVGDDLGAILVTAPCYVQHQVMKTTFDEEGRLGYNTSACSQVMAQVV